MSIHWWKNVLTILSPSPSPSLALAPDIYLCTACLSSQTGSLPRQMRKHQAAPVAHFPRWATSVQRDFFSYCSYINSSKKFWLALFGSLALLDQSWYLRGFKKMICSDWVICSLLCLEDLEILDTKHIWQLTRSHQVGGEEFPPGTGC